MADRSGSTITWRGCIARSARLRIDPGMSVAEMVAITELTLARNLPTEPAEVDWNVIHNVSRGPTATNFAAFAPHELRPTVIVSCFSLVEKLGSLAKAYEIGIDTVVPAQRSIPGELLDDSLKNAQPAALSIGQPAGERDASRSVGDFDRPVRAPDRGHQWQRVSGSAWHFDDTQG